MAKTAFILLAVAAAVAAAILLWPPDSRKQPGIGEYSSQTGAQDKTSQKSEPKKDAAKELLETFDSLDKKVFDDEDKAKQGYRGAASDVAPQNYAQLCPAVKKIFAEEEIDAAFYERLAATDAAKNSYAFLRALPQYYGCEALKKHSNAPCFKLKNYDEVLFRECMQNYAWFEFPVYRYFIKKESKEKILEDYAKNENFYGIYAKDNNEVKYLDFVKMILNNVDSINGKTAAEKCVSNEKDDSLFEAGVLCELFSKRDASACSKIRDANKRGRMVCETLFTAIMSLLENKPYALSRGMADFPYLFKNFMSLFDAASAKNAECRDAAKEWVDYVCENGKTPYNF